VYHYLEYEKMQHSNMESAPQDVEESIKESIKRDLQEKWSEKYKSSINCNNPKGFSQKAHCAGRKK